MNAKKNSSKKVMVILLAVVLLIGCAAGATLAWLVAQTNTVTNTFAVGNITIDLKETVGDTELSAKDAPVENKTFKIVPGATQAKDPKVIVEKGSEKCYVYVCVENNLVVDGTVVGELDINLTDWIEIGTNGTKTVYRYKEVVEATEANKTLPVFTEVEYADTITAEDMKKLTNPTIIISAYAHQSENVTNGTTDTDAAANTHFGTTATP